MREERGTWDFSNNKDILYDYIVDKKDSYMEIENTVYHHDGQIWACGFLAVMWGSTTDGSLNNGNIISSFCAFKYVERQTLFKTD